MKILALISDVGPDVADAVRRLREQYDCPVHVVIPSGLDGRDIEALDELQRSASLVSSFAATPIELKEKHLQLATKAMVHYELGRVAIPVHYQNLRDQLEREYGLAAIRDSQVREILSTSKQIVELQDNVYKSKNRYRDTESRGFLKRWCSLLDKGIFDGVYDLPAYCRRLDELYCPISEYSIDKYPLANCSSYVQLKSAGRVMLIRTHGRQISARCIFDENLEFFEDALLSDLVSECLSPIDQVVLDQLARAREIRLTLESVPTGRSAVSCLKSFADLWMDYIRNQNLRGQEQKWRGWYLVPEHGALTIAKLWELHRILVALAERSAGGSCLVDTSAEGVRNVAALLLAGKVKYREQYTARQKRSLFVRQQKNYLVRLGLVTEPARSHISISDVGEKWLSISCEQELQAAFRSILRQLRWTWCNMPFFSFAIDVARLCDGHISYRELFNWVIHAYDRSQLQEVVLALRTRRNLPVFQRQALDRYIEDKLRSLLERHLSAAAAGHYRTKIFDMMEAFATTGDFVKKGDGTSLRLVLTDQGRKAGSAAFE